MSKTPRTDEKEFAAIDLKPSARVVYASFCRQLENELAEARAEIERLKNEHEDALRRAKNYTVSLSSTVTEYAGELLAKNKQLTDKDRQRDAYKKALEIAEDELMTARAEIERLSSRDGNAKHELVYDGGENPFAREKLEHVDFGVADNQYVLESHLFNNTLKKIKAQNKLIEQMREVLVLFAEGAVRDFHYVCQHRDNCLCLACQKARVKAALAAERSDQ